MTTTTRIDSVEVFDSAGTMALQVDGWDVLHLTLLSWPDDEMEVDGKPRPVLTDEEHQKIIDVIAAALGVNE